jgi:tetratricopeptide (TPR) repeat protein
MRQIQAFLLISTIFISIFAGSLFPGAGAAETCEEWVAKVVSVQGNVQARRVGETQWVPVKLNDTYCPGDMIRVQERSRAAVVLANESILRLDQKTTITFIGVEKERTSLLDLLIGAVHFFSRIPRGLKVATPFVNGIVEGTEFFVKVERDQTFVSIFEGRVAATNEAGSLTLTSGQSAIAQAGQAPAFRIVVRPRDAVQWALYYPPILDYRPADFPETNWQAMVRKSIEFYWEGDLARAFSSLEGAPEDIPDPRFFTYRAGLLLSVGRVDEASVDIERAVDFDPRNSRAFALQSIIAVVQNEKDRALNLARKAVEQDPESPAARVALSYAQQAHFDLKGALASLQEAVKLDPENPLAWARLAELWLSVGNLKKAVDAAQEAVALNPKLARTQTVMGFAYLTKIKIRDAKNAFEKAIELDQAAPLPRLGLGLAKIRQGKLKAGRDEIGIAASLDPNNSLIRSYLGKAYFEEKRDKLAKGQFAIAKELDPLDPTPWFYDAIRKQTLNRPVEALQDLQKSIELNDNRAIYRSRLLLDEDLAARSAGLARIYSDLGFQQRALVEGWKSVNTDPDNYSAHRLLADLYSSLPRHEIARVSELLQSQLWQPINITPLQPQLAESNLLILAGAGPSGPSFNEFNPLFNRNRLALQANGVVGENDTLGDDLVHSGVWGRLSYSFGQFHYETDGFRDNNDLNENVYNVFVQGALSYKTSLQAEFRYLDREYGDLNLFFDRDAFVPDLRNEDEKHSARFGLRHDFTPYSALIASAIYSNGESENVSEEAVGLDIDGEADGYMGEIQHQFSWERIRLVSGIGHVEQDTQAEITDLWSSQELTEEDDINHTNLYTSLLINYPKTVTWTIGGSADFFRSDFYEDEDQFNPKFGITWNPFPSTTARAAVFGVFTRTLVSDQTIEPTQVAGFNQFFDDPTATKSWRYGVAIDQKIFRSLYGGVEFSKRDLEVPFEEVPPPPPGPPQPLDTKIQHTDWDEYLGRAYLYWTPHPWLAASGEFQYEKYEREAEFGSPGNVLELRTYWVSSAISFFLPCGLKMRLQASWVDQEGEFGDPFTGFEPDDDQFWVLDASIGYRLPKRFGLITVEGKNLLNKGFKFQDTDPANPRIVPERFILGRITLSF